MNNMSSNKLEHECFSQPINPETKVWRYMDISKFIDILSRNSLFLSRLDLLGDAHEGSITRINHEARQVEFEKHGITQMITELEKSSKKTNKSMFINCWYCDDYESEAMWKLYCPNNQGVAIQTTYKDLVDSVDYDEQMYIGAIKYIDYESEWFPTGNIFYPVMHKRKAFEYEKEIRLVKTSPDLWQMKENELPFGIHCEWDINKVVENIYVNPYAQNWYYEIVKNIINKYNCEFNIKWSTLKGLPYY